METTNIAVPEALHEFVQARIVEGGYGSASEYVGELIRSDQKQHALTVLGEEILKGASRGACSDHRSRSLSLVCDKSPGGDGVG